MGEYKSKFGEGQRRPSIEIRLPIVVRYLEAPLNQLILKLDVAEERQTRMESTLDRIDAALKALLELEPEAPK